MSDKGGRPTKFNQKLANEICERLMNGESLRSISLSDHMPQRSTIHHWLATNQEFSDQYVVARDFQADTLADELIHIADTAEDVNKARLQVDTRKWAASKLKPKKYGDKLDVTSDGKPMPVLVRFVGEDDTESDK